MNPYEGWSGNVDDLPASPVSNVVPSPRRYPVHATVLPSGAVTWPNENAPGDRLQRFEVGPVAWTRRDQDIAQPLLVYAGHKFREWCGNGVAFGKLCIWLACASVITILCIWIDIHISP